MTRQQHEKYSFPTRAFNCASICHFSFSFLFFLLFFLYRCLGGIFITACLGTLPTGLVAGAICICQPIATVLPQRNPNRGAEASCIMAT
ncbi:uncharacterized protein GGS25DRAFT_505197 [Hypoxylon fragiforme]|uniref:uncharacterized protein n=1 Tax=Hypoxylon fragiforme TaxID=63214 RepID=UPI0020C5BF4C|nr:uncharacterized protein GGS25DRAFT_505197 [Hypoxylon fragiforme]KAI2605463.1 hypothetical protein GGS25DRAFT_505197 [Hypoxylon fragiforme]